MTTRRQGRFRGEPEPKPAKPVPPLRYRILPVERDFDTLDMLQAELDREYNAVPSKMDAEEYHMLKAVLDKRRATITCRRASLTGESIEKDYDAMPYSDDHVRAISFKVTPFMCACALALFVIFGLAMNGH